MTAFPKPQRRLVDRVAERREREAKAQRFRTAVWQRDGGVCRACGRQVKKTIDLVPERGEVHHRRGRNVAPEDRYDVSQALLLCAGCHGDPKVIQRFSRAPKRQYAVLVP